MGSLPCLCDYDCEHLGRRERRLRKEAISGAGKEADHAVPDGPVPQPLLQAGRGGRAVLHNGFAKLGGLICHIRGKNVNFLVGGVQNYPDEPASVLDGF